jgi:hypothetical protein
VRYREAVDRALTAGLLEQAAADAPTIDRSRTSLSYRPRVAPHDPADHFARGLTAYARSEFYEAHEEWEILWRDEVDGARKRFLQGLILIAAAMHKLYVMKSPPGAVRLLDRALDRLEGANDAMAQVSIEPVRRDARRARAALAHAIDAQEAPPAGLAPRIVRGE